MDRFFGRLGSASRGGSGSPHNSDRSRPSSNTENQLYNSRSQSTPQSDFARSAHAAARAGLTQPTGPEGRVITENTDMSSLTDAEIVQLMEGMDDDVLNKPLITSPVPISHIKKEYLRGSPQVLRKLEWLEENGWNQVWRARGDGDCFYRSFTIAYLLRILYSPSSSNDATQALTMVHETLPMMERVGFQNDIIEAFLEPLETVITSFVDPPAGSEPSEYSLLQVLQDPEKSNSIVVALRLITSAYIRTHPGKFAPVLLNPNTLEPMSPEAFCLQEVEPCGKEADNVQIDALAAALRVPVRVAYLDRSEPGADVINWVKFQEPSEATRPLTLLYRPGHFDVVTEDKIQEALVAEAQGHSGSPTVTSAPIESLTSQPSTISKGGPTACAESAPTSVEGHTHHDDDVRADPTSSQSTAEAPTTPTAPTTTSLTAPTAPTTEATAAAVPTEEPTSQPSSAVPDRTAQQTIESMANAVGVSLEKEPDSK